MYDKFTLPDEMTIGASRRGNEYAWTPAAFSEALTKAPQFGYACYGGQFQFRLADATCEMYWIETEWCERMPNETWPEFAVRSCRHTAGDFERLLRDTDFREQARSFDYLLPMLGSGWDPVTNLVFVAYFETEADWMNSRLESRSEGRA